MSNSAVVAAGNVARWNQAIARTSSSADGVAVRFAKADATFESRQSGAPRSLSDTPVHDAARNARARPEASGPVADPVTRFHPVARAIAGAGVAGVAVNVSPKDVEASIGTDHRPAPGVRGSSVTPTPGVRKSDDSPVAAATLLQRKSSGSSSGTAPDDGSVMSTSPTRKRVCVIELPNALRCGAEPKPTPPVEMRLEITSACIVSSTENTLSPTGNAASSPASNEDASGAFSTTVVGNGLSCSCS